MHLSLRLEAALFVNAPPHVLHSAACQHASAARAPVRVVRFAAKEGAAGLPRARPCARAVLASRGRWRYVLAKQRPGRVAVVLVAQPLRGRPWRGELPGGS
eukprot:4650583-Alexandrium_andersonii.AAC.1